MSFKYTITVNDRQMTPDEFAVHTAGRVKLHGGITGICESNEAPMIETDATFLATFGSVRKQFDEDDRYLEEIAKDARAEGHHIPTNAAYCPAIAKHPGDIRAFVTSRGEARAYAEEQGMELRINGRKVTKHRQPEEDPFETAPVLAEDTIQREVQALIDSGTTTTDVMELREQVIEKHGYQD